MIKTSPSMLVFLQLLLVAVALVSGEKKLEKRPTKKAHSLKPTKTPKSILEEFTALPPADVDFIKELDRQFREHGNKIRIKVERSNATDGKNIKRTIEGDLGYGHYSNQPDAGYHFSKPKYMIYPYSQHDIPPARATHSTHETVTDIEITPSHSYELKPIEEVYQVYPTQQYAQEQQQYYHHHQSQQQPKQLFHQEDDTPVIVLKIPGPSKYAAHLQALLQQYLEIRAAQLYKELEEHEYHQQQQHQQQQHHQQQVHQQHYVQQQEVHAHHHHEQQHQQQELQQHHEHHTKTKYSQPDPVYPTEIAYVPMIRTSQNTYVPLPEQYYDTPKTASPRPTKHRKTTVTPTHVTFHSTAQPEPAYHYQTYHPEHQQQQQHAQVHEHHEPAHHAPEHAQIQYQYVAQQPSGHEEEHETQYVYEKPVVNFVTPLPETAHHAHADPYQHHHHQQQQQEQVHHHHQPAQKYPNFAEYHHHHRPQQHQEEEYLPEPKLVENYPSHKHTRVIYKSPALKAELQQEAVIQHDHYHHQQQEMDHHHQEQQQQQQYILQEVYPSQASYFEDKSFVESAGPQVTTDRSETASPHYNTEQVVAITQKPKRLYNYHAHSSGHGQGSGSRGSRMAAGGSRSRSSGSGAKASSKRDAAATPYTEEEFRKVNKMVQRMKKKSRTTPADDAGVLICAVSGESGKHKKKNRRHEEDRSEQVYYVDQIASASAISPWTSNRIIAKTTENGKESQYVINISPEDEVIIHDEAAADRVSDRGPSDEQTPQDFVHEALRLRKQYMQNGPKGTTPMPASSFVEFTTVKYDHFGPSKAPEREAPEPHVIYHSKPVPTKPASSPAPPSLPPAAPTYRPKHMKPKTTKPMLVHTVTPYVAVDHGQSEPVPTIGYRPKEMKQPPKPEPISKTVHLPTAAKVTPIKQQDTAASSLYVQAVRPDEPPFGSSYATHHESGSSYQEFHKFTPNADSQSSSSILTVHKLKEQYVYHPPKSHHVDPPKKQSETSSVSYHGSKHYEPLDKHVPEVSPDFLKLATARPAKHKYADLPKPSPAPSYSKVTSYPTLQSTSPQQEKPTYDPYKFRPSPTPEVSSAGHGFQKISSSPASFPKYIPAKMPGEVQSDAASPGKPIQNLTTSIGLKASPSDSTKTEYYTDPEVTTYYVLSNGTEIKLGDDPSKIPQEFRITSDDSSFLSSNYSTKLAEDFAMKYNWDSLHTVADGEFYLGSASDATLKSLMKEASKTPSTKFHDPIEYIVRDKKKLKPLVYPKVPHKPIKTVTIYKSTHRSSDDLEGGFEPMVGVQPQMDKKSELPGGDDEFYYTNEAIHVQEDPTKASKKNAVYMPGPGMGGRMPGPGMMLKLAPGSAQVREPQGPPVQDMDMSAEPSKKHQYFVLYHIEDKEKKPARPQPPPTPAVPKQEIHYHYSEKESEEPEVTHEHYNYHHEETIEDSDDDIQHHYVNPNYGKFNYRPNIAHPSYHRPLRDSMAAGSETTLKVVDPEAKHSRPLEITKQEYMRHVQNAVLRYMRQLQEEGRLPQIASRDSDDTQKAFEEIDLSALLNGGPKQKFQLNGPVRTNVPTSPSHYKPMKSVPSSSTYKPTASPQNVKLGKNTYTAGKPLKVAIESLQDTLSSNVDLTVKGNKQPVKPDLSAIDVGQSYLHGSTLDHGTSPKGGHSYDGPSSGASPKTKLHFNQQSHHDINTMLNAKEGLRTNLKGSYLDHASNNYGSIKGGSANVGASISFGNGGMGLPKGIHASEDDNKIAPEALDAPIQIINGIPITNPYNIDINTLRYMLGGLAQAQAEQQQQQQHSHKEPALKLKGSNWMSLPTMASPTQLFQGLLKQHPIMSKKVSTNDWKPTTVKPTTGPSKAVKIDTNLRPPPPVVKG
uniref:Uncharacterized protein n=1 Tax=Anopheles dirus TaxID=7168 RepID=A0A182NQH8_9DIPT